MARLSPRVGRLGVPGAVLAAALLLLAPLLLRRGFAVVGDMAFVPRQPWRPAWLGLDTSPPRSVPADALVSAITQVVPGDLVQKLVLLGALLLAGLGAARLLRLHRPGASTPAVLGAGLLYLWNPWVDERLAIGHWGLLLGYAALPWVWLAAAGLRARGSGWGPLLLWTAVAAVGSPTGGLLAAGTALVAAAGRLRITLGVLATGVLVNLPWLLPGLLGDSGASDPGGVAVFAARSDTPLGTWGSLLGLGGIWKAAVVPPERSTWLLAVLAALLGVLALAALARGAVRPRDAGDNDRRLLVLAVLSLLAAALPATGPGGRLLADLVGAVPGAGLLRDSQKLLAPFAMVVAVGFGSLLADGARRVRLPALPATALAVLPVLLLPSAVWGLSGVLEPVRYPGEWQRVADVLAARAGPHDRMVVVPWSTYHRYPWNGTRASIDPAIRWFPVDVVSDQDLVVRGAAVPGDDPLARRLGGVLRTPGVSAGRRDAVLDEAHVRWVLVEQGPGAGVPVPAGRGRVVHAGAELRLVDRGPVSPPAAASYRLLVLGVDGVVAALVLAAGITAAARAVRRRRGTG